MNRSRTPSRPVMSKRYKDRDSSPYWVLTCRYCMWSARVGDKVGVSEVKREHAKTCHYYREALLNG